MFQQYVMYFCEMVLLLDQKKLYCICNVFFNLLNLQDFQGSASLAMVLDMREMRPIKCANGRKKGLYPTHSSVDNDFPLLLIQEEQVVSNWRKIDT